MKYNIVTVSNEGYKDFLKVFLSSLFDNADSDNLESVFVFDTGLSEETKKNLEAVSDKIQFVPTDLKAESSAVHDEGWAKNTYSKTKFLFYSLNSTQQPCFLIDVDSVFQSNFEKEINWDSDFSVCWRGDNHPISDHLGSFFGAINVAKSLLFLKIWMMQLGIVTRDKELFELKGIDWSLRYNMNHLESPSLSYCIKSFNGFFDYHNVEENKISCVKTNPLAKIYHLKSDGFALTIQERLNLPYAKKLVDKYV
tara:strand:- start:6578 stop:7336 length:759 start_codon:yes stop_codon:yes gene_type:complete